MPTQDELLVVLQPVIWGFQNFSGGWKNTTDLDFIWVFVHEINQHVLLKNVKIFQSFGSMANLWKSPWNIDFFAENGEMMYENHSSLEKKARPGDCVGNLWR